ncbi:SIS domain-containing protein [Deinococcus ruber]|uniref:Glucosamine--fructose-6-phosphate aminotransferase n=1 Tax=Deinococcus ruber TaxID=1848197 RepID=A0A918FAT5_9DEIO|nr:SIS domain-containing protein [Deinococcus ruber]GGR25589.1 glucosamine--fructose-6-phosphate aminotransferase [Deinococcus ruber]
MNDPLMLQEARETPQVVAQQLERNRDAVRQVAQAIRERQPAFGVTVARGSSDHACTVLKYALETRLGLSVASAHPSVYTLYGSAPRLNNALVVAVSQSGASPDVVETVRMAREQGALTVALVNMQGSDLGEAAEFVLPLQAGDERAVAATKSFLASLTAFLPVLAELTADSELQRSLETLPQALTRTLALEGEARDRAEPYRYADSLIALGRGLHYGVAQEAALKLKETSGIHAEAYSAAEFSHGPKRLISEGVPLLAFTSRDAAGESAKAAYQSLLNEGADLLALGTGTGPDAGRTLLVPATGHPLTDPVSAALAFYLFAAHLSLGRGLNPDEPPLLSKVTKTR